MWIKENKILLTALFISVIFHLILFESGFYNNNKVIPPKIVSFEIMPPLKKGKAVEAEQDAPAKTPQVPQDTAEKTQPAVTKTAKVKEKHEKQKRETSDTAGNAAYDNNAAIYEKENLEIIRDMIVNRIIYPPQAKKLGIEGSGYLVIIIDNSGKIISVSANDFPNRLLSEAALKAAKKVGQVAGHSLASVEMKIPINFHLR